jgi:L-arabinose isomerase
VRQSSGGPAAKFRDLAAILSTEPVVIDGATTIPSLQNELRWSAAYHRLATRL